MAGYRIGRARWIDPDCFPVEEVLGNGVSIEKNAVMLVDVGGSTGRDISAFHELYPQLPGRLVLQDLPAVIKEASNLPEGIEAMAHDFFTPQPVKGKSHKS